MKNDEVIYVQDIIDYLTTSLKYYSKLVERYGPADRAGDSELMSVYGIRQMVKILTGIYLCVDSKESRVYALDNPEDAYDLKE